MLLFYKNARTRCPRELGIIMKFKLVIYQMLLGQVNFC